MHSLELQELQKLNYKAQSLQVLESISGIVFMAHFVKSTHNLLLSKK